MVGFQGGWLSMGKKRRNKEALDGPADAFSRLGQVESLQNAGFITTEKEQERFISRLLQKMYYRLEVPTDRRISFAGGLVLCVLGAGYLGVREDIVGSCIFLASAALHLVGLVGTISARRRRSKAGGESHPDAAFVADDGNLEPILDNAESILSAADADGRVQLFARHASGLFQLCWGVLLGGLPVASGTQYADSFLSFLAIVFATFFGTLVFGRGARSIWGVQAVQRIVLTDQRVVAIAGPGAALSVPLEHLRVRPAVVARENDRASLAFELRPLSSVAPIPIMGILGLDDMEGAEAEQWARLAMDARFERMRGHVISKA
jgi:hypothetical protein